MLTLGKLLPREKLRGNPRSVPSRVPSGRLWPHDEFSYGYRPLSVDGGQWHENPLQVSARAEQAISDDWAIAQFPLDLREVSNSHKSAKRGLKGITGYGRNMVKAVGALLNRYYPQHRVTFCTLTLPQMTEDQRRSVVSLWSDLTRELLQWLSRRLESAAVPQVVCSVTEIQPKRLQSSGQGYLHWHLIWLNVPAKSGSWSVNPVDLKNWLHSILQRKMGVSDLGHVNCDVKRVKGEVARYMAKYMSKGSDVLEEAQADWGEDCTPSTWWNMTKPARDWVKAKTLVGDEIGSALEELVQWGFKYGSLDRFPFIRHVDILFGDRLITVGWRGRLEPSDSEAVRAVLNCV